MNWKQMQFRALRASLCLCAQVWAICAKVAHLSSFLFELQFNSCAQLPRVARKFGPLRASLGHLRESCPLEFNSCAQLPRFARKFEPLRASLGNLRESCPLELIFFWTQLDLSSFVVELTAIWVHLFWNSIWFQFICFWTGFQHESICLLIFWIPRGLLRQLSQSP
jgi:hypothetical protein